MDTREAAPLMIGRKVEWVDGTTLHLDSGATVRCSLDADCCSSSDFTDEGQFAELAGATILDVEDRGGKSNDGLLDPKGADVLKWHFLVFTTSKGHVTIDWRNKSNGYYDGNVCWELRTPAEVSSPS